MTACDVRFPELSTRWGWRLLPLGCLLVVATLMGVGLADLAWPFFREGDVYQTCRWLKSLLENGSYYHTARLGAPWGATHYGFPLSFVLPLPLAWLIGAASDNIYLVFNVLFFCGCLASGAAAYWALLRLGARGWAAWGMALVYAFLPNHLARYEHLSISYAVAAPGIVWLACELFRGRQVGRAGCFWALVAATTGVYTAFFSCCVLLAAGLVGGWCLRSRGPLVSALRSVALLVGVLALILLPNWLGCAPDLAPLPERRAEDIHNYSLSLDRMVLPLAPRAEHPLSALSAAYYTAFPNPAGPRESAYLGLLALAGLLLLARGLRTPDASPLHELALLAGFLLILASGSGLAPLLSMVIGRGIRCYNRVSFFVAFIGLAVMALRLSTLKSARVPAALLLTVLALWEHSRSLPRWDPQLARAEVMSCRDFVAQLESRLPPGSLLWHAPWIEYPETVQRFREGEYAWAKLYLVSTRLRWGWGDMKGRWPEAVRSACGRLAWPVQAEVLRESGFAGIVVLRSAFEDNGAATEDGLRRCGLRPEVTSEDGQWVFYPLGPGGGDSASFERRVAAATLGRQPLRFQPGSGGSWLLRRGWSRPEPDGCWTEGDRAMLRLPDGLVGSGSRVRLRMTPYIAPERTQTLSVLMKNVPVGTWTFSVQRPERVEFTVAGPGLLELRVGNPTRPSDHGVPDSRTLGIMLHSLEVVDITHSKN